MHAVQACTLLQCGMPAQALEDAQNVVQVPRALLLLRCCCCAAALLRCRAWPLALTTRACSAAVETAAVDTDATAHVEALIAELSEYGFYCACCGIRREKTLRCGACRVMRYCGRKCQQTHRDAHRPLCKLLTQDRANEVDTSDRVIRLQDHNLAAFRAVENMHGWARSRGAKMLTGDIIQEENMWRDIGDFKNAASAHILIIRSLAMMATVQCKLADIPPEHRHGPMRYLREDCEMTVYSEVDVNMPTHLALARALAKMHGPGTLRVELRDAAALVETTSAGTRATLAERPPDQYVDPESNHGWC